MDHFIYNRFINRWYIRYDNSRNCFIKKHSDLESEIISLRLQRKMLKDELLKQKLETIQKRKYKPRKKNDNNEQIL